MNLNEFTLKLLHKGKKFALHHYPILFHFKNLNKGIIISNISRIYEIEVRVSYFPQYLPILLYPMRILRLLLWCLNRRKVLLCFLAFTCQIRLPYSLLYSQEASNYVFLYTTTFLEGLMGYSTTSASFSQISNINLPLQ